MNPNTVAEILDDTLTDGEDHLSIERPAGEARTFLDCNCGASFEPQNRSDVIAFAEDHEACS